MKKLLVFSATMALFGISATLSATDANAAMQASALAGWGFNDGYHFGLGARGGLDLPNNFWGGLTYLYHFGNEVISGTGTTSTWFLQAEGGYTITMMSDTRVRPFVGLGVGHTGAPTITAGGLTISNSSTDLAFTPGIAIEKDINPNTFIGGEGRLNLVSGNTAFGLYASIGIRY